jgi:hypothetical protein
VVRFRLISVWLMPLMAEAVTEKEAINEKAKS